MIYYSIVPLDFVMKEDTGDYAKTVEIKYNGQIIQAIPIENNKYVISRLISTSPDSYLNPAFQPGKIIKGN